MDTGEGHGREDQGACKFEPFFTTKATGTGFGLAMVDSIVEQVGGHVRVESDGSDAGTSFSYLCTCCRPGGVGDSTPSVTRERSSAPSGSSTWRMTTGCGS